MRNKVTKSSKKSNWDQGWSRHKPTEVCQFEKYTRSKLLRVAGSRVSLKTWPNVAKRDQTWPNVTKRDQTWPNSLSAWHFSSSKPLGDFWSRDQSYIHTDKMSRSYFIKHIKQVSQDICQTNQCLKIICIWLILIAKRFPKGLNSPYAKQICEVSEPSGFRSPLLLTWSPPIWVTDSLLAQSPGSKGLDGAQPDTSAPVASESCKIF